MYRIFQTFIDGLAEGADEAAFNATMSRAAATLELSCFASLKARSPQWMPPRAVSGPILLTGICFCASCGGAMTLRTGKGSRYRYYTCSTKARMGEKGCRGLTVPMDKLDRAVADHLEWRPLDPPRLATMMDQLLERREEWNERRRGHIAELRKRAARCGSKIEAPL